MPTPWVSALEPGTEYLYSFELLDLSDVLCLTTESFVAQRLAPVLRIPRDDPGALLVTASRALQYRPVPVDSSNRVNLTDVGDFFDTNGSNRTLPIVLYGGADHMGICEASKFDRVRARLAQEEEKWIRIMQHANGRSDTH